MKSLRSRLEEAARVAPSQLELQRALSRKERCKWGFVVAKTSCCGNTYLCTNEKSANHGRRGTKHLCGRCPDHEPEEEQERR